MTDEVSTAAIAAKAAPAATPAQAKVAVTPKARRPYPLVSSPTAANYPPKSHSGFVLEKRETPYSTTLTAFPARARARKDKKRKGKNDIDIHGFIPVLPLLPKE